ncbi:MAG: aminodeoxychorismate synthase component I [Planctomycetota bacterium]|jgi:para-aminobenzoate synthetase component 1
MAQQVQCSIVERGCRPLAYLRAVADRPHPALLDSSQHPTPLGRYSILCWDPLKKVTCREGVVEAEDLRDGSRSLRPGDPFRALSAEFGGHRIEVEPGFDLPFAGGAVGYFSYDLRHRIESLPRSCHYDLDVPEFVLCFYDRALVFDHQREVTHWVGPAGAPVELPRPLAESGCEQEVEPVALASNFTREEYLAAIRRAKDYIAAGDIFQVNLAQRFSGECPADGLALYARLRRINPAPFAAYLKHPEFEIISSSPERFLLVEGDRVSTRPIKGTRPRREGDEVFNARMLQELCDSAKDHAELTMIVDLERNDLGRVCNYGTVGVAEHAVVETYPTVFHLVSTVTGELYRAEHDEFSLIRATFPGGSITGAPKIRAMEIIEELEPHARAVYTGSVGYVSFHGRMDLNIVIRTMLKMDGRLYLQFGGGIVADSDPVLEYEETLHKGRALFEALNAGNYDEIMREAAHERR